MTFSELDCAVHPAPLTPIGGQHVGTSPTVLVVHSPSGIGVYWNAERSQLRNRQQAMAALELLVSTIPAPSTEKPE